MAFPAYNWFDSDTWYVDYAFAADGTLYTSKPGSQDIAVRTHSPSQCAGHSSCVVHNPSDHHMRSWPIVWRSDKGTTERRCSHGLSHPDPDDLLYHLFYTEREDVVIHGCDGCCADETATG